MIISALQPGVAITLVVVFVVVAIPLIWLLARATRKDRLKFIDSKAQQGILNKTTFDEMLKRRFEIATKRTHFSCFYIEINDARNMRQSFGDTQYGNALKEIIQRIEKIFPHSVKACQYELDSIVVFSDDDYNESELNDLATFMVLEAKKTVNLSGGLQLDMEVNIGIASYNTFNDTYQKFWQNLELALVVSKRNGVNQFAVHTSELNNTESEEYQYYVEIKSAIDNNEFVLFYQPIVNLETGVNYGFESLLRWNHRTLGVIPPSQFLNILEQSGDITWVGMWAFEQLLKQKAEWASQFPDRPLVLSMNLSPKQLMSDKLCDDMRRILRKYRVDPSTISLEIVEFTMFDKMPIVKENVTRLHQMGFKVAVDDFGLDMSNFSILEQVEIDIIKLDRKFVAKAIDEKLSAGMMTTLINYATDKNIMLIGEGVEDERILEYLKGLGILLGQGYYFQKPAAAHNIIL